MIGRRIYSSADGLFQNDAILDRDYGKGRLGWFARLPNSVLISLDSHRVIEHADGTVTVEGDIEWSDRHRSWRGRLVKGKWVEE